MNEGEGKGRERERLNRQRLGILAKLEHWLELPMVVLGAIWLVLLVIDLTTRWGEKLQPISDVIWGIFVIDFAVKFLLAPKKGQYLKKNWLTLIALALPALRVFRIVRAFRFLRIVRTGRGLRLLRVVTSLNRGMNAFGHIMRKRGLPYIIALTVIVTFAGAAGMYAFERDRGLETYGKALWWTAMIMTTMGSEYWPKTVEGQTLCVLLALYAFSVFGYVTAALASFFVDRDAKDSSAKGEKKPSLGDLLAEIEALKTEVRLATAGLKRER
jgi:voltage-gated potassium channel